MASPSSFEIRDVTDGATRVLAVEGELDLSTVGVLARGVEDRLGESPGNLTLDLSAVTFMDSSGLRLLIELSERARREEWQLTLRPSLHEPANAVLRMTGADGALPFEPPVGG
jgi:anti-sigma B factor antagonist